MDSIVEKLELMKSYAEKALLFLNSEKEMREDELTLQDLLSKASEKAAINILNLRSKGQVRNMRNLQIMKRFSDKTKQINNVATTSLGEYNKMAKNYSERLTTKNIVHTIEETSEEKLCSIRNPGRSC